MNVALVLDSVHFTKPKLYQENSIPLPCFYWFYWNIQDKYKNKPWILENETGQHQFQGQLEGAHSDVYYLLMMQGKEFVAIPAGSWYVCLRERDTSVDFFVCFRFVFLGSFCHGLINQAILKYVEFYWNFIRQRFFTPLQNLVMSKYLLWYFFIFP